MNTATLPAPAQHPTKVSVLGIDYVLVETNAPPSYDYDTIELTTGMGPGETRFTLVPAPGLKSQLARYASGLFGGVVSDMYPPYAVEGVLLQRMRRTGGP